jgi:hypothetical protein
MHRNEFDNLVYVAARYGASLESQASLVAKVRAMAGGAPSLRLIAAATLFHCWLLKGKPDKRAWQYRARLRYARDVMAHFVSTFSEEERQDLSTSKPSAPSPPPAPLMN